MAKKKTAPKAAPKTAPKKAPKKADVSTEALPEPIQELVDISSRLDKESLDKLLEAARILDTRTKIVAFNRELNVAASKAAKRRQELSAPEYRVSIEQTQDDFFIIQLDDVRVFFNRGELKEITKICHAVSRGSGKKPAAAAARRLFKWFEKERSDLLVDAGINSEKNPYLIDLYEVIVSTYKVKG